MLFFAVVFITLFRALLGFAAYSGLELYEVLDLPYLTYIHWVAISILYLIFVPVRHIPNEHAKIQRDRS